QLEASGGRVPRGGGRGEQIGRGVPLRAPLLQGGDEGGHGSRSDDHAREMRTFRNDPRMASSSSSTGRRISSSKFFLALPHSATLRTPAPSLNLEATPSPTYNSTSRSACRREKS